MPDVFAVDTNPVFVGGQDDFERTLSNGGPGALYYDSERTVSSISNDGSIPAGATKRLSSPTWVASASASKLVMEDVTAESVSETVREGDLNLDVRDFGADSSLPDNTVAIQAALDKGAALGRPVLIPGFFNMTGSLVWPNGALEIIGIGKRLSGLVWTASAGVGAYGLGWSGFLTATRRRVAHLTLQGPGTYALNTHPTTMHGLRLPQTATIEDCRVYNFDKGLVIERDHQRILNCQIQNNYYNVYFQVATDGVEDGWANQYFDKCELDGATFASVGIDNNATCAWTSFRDCHFGWGPYGFYLEAGAANAGGMGALDNVVFDMCSFENVGNGMIFDQDGTKAITRVTWNNCVYDWATGGQSVYVIPATAKDWVIRVQQLLNCRVQGGGIWQAGDEGVFKVLGGAGLYGLRELHLYDATDTLVYARENSKALVQASRCEGCTWQGDECEGPIVLLGTDCATSDLMAGGASAVVFNTFDVYHRALGVAYMAGDASDLDCVPIVTSGVYPIKTNETLTVSGDQIMVQADERTEVLGKVRAVTTDVYSPIIGVTYANSSGGLVDTRIRISEQVPSS